MSKWKSIDTKKMIGSGFLVLGVEERTHSFSINDLQVVWLEENPLHLWEWVPMMMAPQIFYFSFACIPSQTR